MKEKELSLPGRHNLYNSMAAGISARILEIRKDKVREALSDFKGVEHRLEKVADVRGVSFINDSKANQCQFVLVCIGEYDYTCGADSWRKR